MSQLQYRPRSGILITPLAEPEVETGRQKFLLSTSGFTPLDPVGGGGFLN